MSLHAEIEAIARRAQQASAFCAVATSEQKNKAIEAMARGLESQAPVILKANQLDVECAAAENNSSAFIDRLRLTEQRIKKMSDDLRAIVALPDPVGEMIKMWRRPNGLMIGKMRVPLGVIGIIYESRPNVTSDCAGLCLKSGNAVILRGGRESINSNTQIYRALANAVETAGFPAGTIGFIETIDREAVTTLLGMADFIDLIIPRGGESLIRNVVEHSKIPVIKHYKGICHTYVDEHADLAMAEQVAFNAKVQRPSTCNAMECLLVHHSVAEKFLPRMVQRLQQAGVEIRGCSQTAALCPGTRLATDQDYATEYLDLVLSVKVVASLAEAAAHIVRFGSKHSEAIITDNFQTGMSFLRSVDAACVYLNASTRFTDGNEFGLGAEIGVSTDKLHARGPMGLEELTTYKYVVMGNGQIRE